MSHKPEVPKKQTVNTTPTVGSVIIPLAVKVLVDIKDKECQEKLSIFSDEQENQCDSILDFQTNFDRDRENN